jgi:putative flippase GtrA
VSSWLPTALAILVARLVGAGVGFVLHKRVTFSNTNPIRTIDVVMYSALWVANYAASTIAVDVLSRALGAPVLLSKVLTDILIFVLNYLFLSRIFRRPPIR